MRWSTRSFDGFDRYARPKNLYVATLTEYEEGLPAAVAFPPLVVPSLAERFSELGWRQFHVAETEKYAHVTYFFNGGTEAAWPGEERVLVPSAHVATYDLEPAMRASQVADALLAALASGRFDFLVANFANADMVGHTGHFDATVSAVEALDEAVGRVADAVLALDAAAPIGGGPALHHGRSRQCRRDDRRRRAPRDGPFAQPRAAAAGRPVRARCTVARRRARRRRADAAGTSRPGSVARHDRPRPAGAASRGLSRGPCYPARASPHRRTIAVVDPFLALGQIALSAGVVASILLQSRGAGMGQAFGGDSAVYRSRRGIEKILLPLHDHHHGRVGHLLLRRVRADVAGDHWRLALPASRRHRPPGRAAGTAWSSARASCC